MMDMILDEILSFLQNILASDRGLFIGMGVIAIVIVLYLIKHGSNLVSIVKDKTRDLIKSGVDRGITADVVTNRVIDDVVAKLERPDFSFRFKKIAIKLLRSPWLHNMFTEIIETEYRKLVGVGLPKKETTPKDAPVEK